MPNRDTHVTVGIAVGLGTSLYLSKDQRGEYQFWEAIGGALGGYGGGRCPDVFEYAYSPNHRGFVHSFAAGTTISITAKEAIEAWVAFFREKADGLAEKRKKTNLTGSDKLIINICEILLRVAAGVGPGFIAGYVSHLALDACTRRSLPLA